MNWIVYLEDLDKKIIAHINSELDNTSDESQLVKSLCSVAQRNIALFMFGTKGRSNSSYVDIMKTAIRRQIELNQRTTLPFVKKIDPIIDLWQYKLEPKDFAEIDKYWASYFNFPSGDTQKIKKEASDYVHPIVSLKILRSLPPQGLAQRLYDEGGAKIKRLDFFLKRLDLTMEVKESLREQVSELFGYDVQCMMDFGDLFISIIKTFNKRFVR